MIFWTAVSARELSVADPPGNRMLPPRYLTLIERSACPCAQQSQRPAAGDATASRVPAAHIGDVIIKLLNEHIATNQDKSTTSAVRLADHSDLARQIIECLRRMCSRSVALRTGLAA